MSQVAEIEKPTLTQSMIREVGATGRKQRFPDHKVSGLQLRVTGGGKKAFVVRYRDDAGTSREMKIGEADKMPLKQARDVAREKLALVGTGGDPLAEKRGRQEAARLAKSNTVAALAERYRQSPAFTTKRPSTQGFYSNSLDVHILPEMGHKPVDAVTRVDVSNLLDTIQTARTGGVANSARRTLSVLFSFAVEKGIVDFNPVSAVKAKHRIPVRRRTLTDSELAALWGRVSERDGLSETVADMLHLCLLLPARRGEIAGMEWDELDLTAALWTLPPDRTKSHRVHQLPLGPRTVALLRQRQNGSQSPYVFPDKTGSDPINPKRAGRACNRMAKRMEVPSFGPHDLRRTIATRLAEKGLGRDLLERLLGHNVGAGRAIVHYDHYDYQDRKREALEAWEVEATRIMSLPAICAHATPA